MFEVIIYVLSFMGYHVLVDVEEQTLFNLPMEMFEGFKHLCSGYELVKGSRYVYGMKVLDVDEFNILADLVMEKGVREQEVQDKVQWIKDEDERIKSDLNSSY